MLDIWITDFWLLLKGAVIGFAVAAPVGPIGMLCIRTTLERGRVAGFAAGLGAAVADAVYGAIGVLGVTAISGIIEAQRFWLELGGGIFVIGFGIHLGLTRPNYQNNDEIPVSLFADFLKTLLLTLANPSTILTFMAIFAGVPAAAGAAELETVPVIVLGVLLGSAAWWLTLSAGVGFIRHRISERALKLMNWVAGILLVGFGVYTLGHLALHWPS
jgi:threonine/homoserine/homoserine lactone efflux protein